jgi:hypothetical protein
VCGALANHKLFALPNEGGNDFGHIGLPQRYIYLIISKKYINFNSESAIKIIISHRREYNFKKEREVKL